MTTFYEDLAKPILEFQPRFYSWRFEASLNLWDYDDMLLASFFLSLKHSSLTLSLAHSLSLACSLFLFLSLKASKAVKNKKRRMLFVALLCLQTNPSVYLQIYEF